MPVLDNARHEIFAQQIAKGASNREAYKTAGYDSENLESVDASAARLLADVRVEQRVKELQEEAAKATGVTVQRVVAELAKIGFSDTRAALSWGPDGVLLKSSADLTADEAAAVAEVHQTKDGIRIKLHDKQAALVNLGKHLGMFSDKLELTGKDGGAIETKEVSGLEMARRIAFILAAGAQAKPTDKG